MKLFRFAAPAILLAGVLLAPARAQLVHLAFTGGDYNGMIFRADSAFVPWNHTGGYISRFDLWYDPSNPTDPTRNVWRANVFGYGIGSFEIVRSHQGLWVSDDNMMLSYWKTEGGFESMEFGAQLIDNIPADPGLPVPPFTIQSYSVFLDGGPAFFDVPHMGEGYGSGSFQNVRVTMESSVVLHAVPEPSTYGLAAISVLALAVLRTRCRAVPTTASR